VGNNNINHSDSFDILSEGGSMNRLNFSNKIIKCMNILIFIFTGSFIGFVIFGLSGSLLYKFFHTNILIRILLIIGNISLSLFLVSAFILITLALLYICFDEI
jgi:hypothetical protein